MRLQVENCGDDNCKISAISMTGCMAAIGVSEYSRYYGYFVRLRVVDVCRRRVRTLIEVGPHSSQEPNPRRGLVAITDVEVTADGHVAWIAGVDVPATDDSPASFFYEVRKADADGRVLLDSSPEIAPKSLARSGTRLYWVRAESAQFAQLVG